MFGGRLAHNVKALLSGFEFEKQMYMTKEQLSNMACEAYNSLGMNPPHYHWMDGFVAGYLAHQQNLQQCNVSGSYDKGIHLDWWNDTDRFAMLKKYGYQDEKKPWKYKPLTNKGIYLMYIREQNG